MTIRLVQPGAGSTRVVAFVFLVGEHMDLAMRTALGPNVCIVADVDSHGTESMGALLAWARARAGVSEFAGYALIGYSMGCSRVRSLLTHGCDPCAVLTIDGTHANWPPHEWQLEVWRDLATRARRGNRLWVATATQQTYTESLKAPDSPFMASVHVLEDATGQKLPPGTEVHDGALHVVSYASKRIDKDAHIAQQREVLPAILREHLAPWLAAWVEPPNVALPEPRSVGGHAIARIPGSSATDTGELGGGWGGAVLAAAKADLTAGIREHGHNAGPEIERLYLNPLGVPPGSSYCAAAVSSWIRRAARELGQNAPVKGSAGAKALGEQFKAAGLWTAAGPLLREALRPGSVLLWDRSEPMGSGWQGHVGVVCDVGQGVAFTIEANADRPPPCDAVAMVERRLDDPRLLGAGRWPVT